MDKSQLEATDRGDLFSFTWWEGATKAEIGSAISAADVHARDKHKRTALMMVARHGSPDNIKALIEAGADVHAQDDIGWTPLMWAVNSGKPNNIEVVLEAGADVEARDK